MPDTNELHYIQHTLNILTEQVAKLATAMERLATMEERSAYLSRAVEDLKDEIKKSEEKNEKHREKIEEKVSAVNLNVVKIMAVAGTIITILSIKGSAIMTLLFGANTMSIPAKYAYLSKEPGPKILLEALKLLGTKEVPGDGDSPVILGWAKELGGDVAKTYRDDMIPWCGLFAAIVATRAGWTPPKTPLWARAWAEFGVKAEVPSLGDICVFTRKGGGHVAIYVGEDDTHYHILGGNQGDAVTIVRKSKKECIAVRRPVWKSVAPPNRRPIKLSASGAVISQKED